MGNNNPLGFLSKNKVDLPVGGDFSPSGFILNAYAQVLYAFMAQEDSSNYEVPPYEGRTKAGDWGFNYFYETQSAAKAAIEIMGIKNSQGKPQNARSTWVVRGSRDTVINFADKKKLAESFTDPVSWSVDIASLRSAKRHEFHLITLPLAVVAVANLLGYENAGYDISELLNQNTLFTDDFQAKMIGHPDHKKLEDEFHYTKSILWQRRAALWASLGETNPESYQVIGSEKAATESEKLSTCLGLVQYKWESPTWARVIQVPDPRVDATYTNKKSGETARESIMAISELFLTKADAEKAAQVDLDRANKKEDTTASNGNGASPAIPTAWAEVAEEWLAKVAELKTAGAKASPKLAKELDVDIAELKAWL